MVFEKFTDTFARFCIAYTDYVNVDVMAMAEIKELPALDRTQLLDEVRVVNVLAVTLGRLEALKTGQQFGINAGV